MSEEKDNVVEFPTAAKTEKTIEERDEEGVPVVLKLMEKNRKEGLNTLDRKCESLDTRQPITGLTPVDENLMRTVEQSIQATNTTLIAMNSMLDMLRHDLVGTIQALEQDSIFKLIPTLCLFYRYI